MKEIYKKIKEASSKMQDLRDDLGHAETVTNFAELLSQKMNATQEIVLPAAILHDIGYFGMDLNLLKLMMEKKLPEIKIEEIKEEHMKNGVKLAEEILVKLNYDSKFISIIKEIICRHDLDDESKTKEEKIVRDSDKLWRYSNKGFFIDVKRRNCTPLEWYDKLKKNFDKNNYFQTKEAKEIALLELEKRHKEF